MPIHPQYWVPLPRGVPAYALYAAWWGKEITQRTTIQPRSDDTNVDKVSSRTTVDIDQSVNGVKLGKILLRQEFLNTRTFIESYASKNPHRGLVITGQPGIGKTYFLWYLLRYRLSQELPTLFALGEGLYFFHETGGYLSGPERMHLTYWAVTASKPHVVWSLIDRSTEVTEPSHMLWEGSLFPVQMTRPDPSLFKGWIKQRCGAVFTMNPWDWDELVAGFPLQRRFRLEDKCDFSLPYKIYNKYGPVPRNVYDAYSHGGAIPYIDDCASNAIHQASRSFNRLESIVSSISIYDTYSDISSDIICLRRLGTFSACNTLLSRFVLDELLKAEAFRLLDTKRRVCELFVSTPETGASRGLVFEKYGHLCLSSDSGICRTFPLTPVSDAPQKYRHHRTPAGPQATSYHREQRKIRLFESLDDFHRCPPSEGEYCLPVARNKPVFQPFVVTKAAVYIFQLSVESREHRIDSWTREGLGLLKKVVPSDRPWHYALVVPWTDEKLVTLTVEDEKWVNIVDSFQLIMLFMDVA